MNFAAGVALAVLVLLLGGSSSSGLLDGNHSPVCRRSQVSLCAYRYGGRVLVPNHLKYVVPQGKVWLT